MPVDAHPIRLLLADVDGTLVTPDKALTDRTVTAVRKLREAGIQFAVTSGRPPRGMAMLIEPLDIQTPIAAFNGGLLVDRDLTVLEHHSIDRASVLPVAALLAAHELDVWLYRGAEWYVTDLSGPHVDREAATVRFSPTLVDGYEHLTGQVAKLVGVSDDARAIEAAARAAHEQFADRLSVSTSQPYYVDVTSPRANKGAVVDDLARRCAIPPDAIATIGDGANDVLMFARSGLSIAMGNASAEVKAAAGRTTASNDEDGFAAAVERYVLPGRFVPR